METIDLKTLSIEQKIGQLIMFGFDALTLNQHAIKLIKELKIGNVILFTRNIQTPKQVFELTKALQQLAMETIGIPLLISIDQEGGMVTRIRQGGTFFPGAMTIAATNKVDVAYQVGLKMGQELDALGINMNLAPVFDVNNNPKNPVIGVRSYSDDPSKVAEYGVNTMLGMQQHVVATGKHFPGHGDTHVDSHLSLPRVDCDLERLETVELYPFKKAVDNGIQAIMSSHVSFPVLEPSGLPSTLSKAVLTDLLRKKMQFKGLIITDCMQMKAIQNHYSTPNASKMSIEAGADMICISHSEELQTKSYEYLLESYRNKTLSEDLINERVARILALKATLKPPHLPKSYDSVKDLVENLETRTFAAQVTKDAVTLVKGKALVLKASSYVIAMTPKATTIADDADGSSDIEALIQQHLPALNVTTIDPYPNLETIDRMINSAKDYDQIIVCTYNANIYPSQITLVNGLASLNRELHVIAMRNPYDLFYTKNIDNFVCLFEHTPNSVKALIDYLKGDLKPRGRMPVNYE